ncbi:hypothetical protein HGRIS_014350 [Hohenbuehelia grisea]|uniref:Uncharacterized protein n=1 Tax=Hohenbuehelia grisea TaxID=104357 RepID=A0ABR3JU54_9AGAR
MMLAKLLQLALFVALCNSQTVTLSAVDPTGTDAPGLIGPTNSVSITPIGVGANGETTYLEHQVKSAALERVGSGLSFTTVPVERFTMTGTIIADGSVYIYSHIPTATTNKNDDTAVVQTCRFGSDGQGECVDKFWPVGESNAETITVTYGGTARPFYTLTAGNAQSGGGSSSGSGNSAVSRLIRRDVLILGLSLLPIHVMLMIV